MEAKGFFWGFFFGGRVFFGGGLGGGGGFLVFLGLWRVWGSFCFLVELQLVGGVFLGVVFLDFLDVEGVRGEGGEGGGGWGGRGGVFFGGKFLVRGTKGGQRTAPKRERRKSQGKRVATTALAQQELVPLCSFRKTTNPPER